MTPAGSAIATALAIYREACAEVDYWHRQCAIMVRIAGPGIWREGHPLDREKLRQRSIWRARERIARRRMLNALGALPVGEPGQ